MKWMQNRESVELILNNYWPKIKSQIPDCQLYIIGRYAPEFFGKFASEDVIIAEADSDGQKYDPQYYYQHSWLLLAPMGSGGGTRNKFLEGMAFGLPVITNPEGGMGSIKIKNYEHAIVCPDKDIVKNSVKILTDSKFRKKIGDNAQKLIKNEYSFERGVEGLNQIYENITKNNPLLSVIILNYNSEVNILGLSKSIVSSELDDYSIEVIIADNASSDTSFQS